MKKLLLLVGLAFGFTAQGQSTLYDINTVQNIEIFFSQPDWNHQLHVLKITTDGYLKSDSVRINGVTLPKAGVKYKGNSSYDSTWVKNPWTIGLDKFQNQNYQGYTSLKLSNMYQDPSLIREALSYNLIGNYMECSKSNFARVYVNGQYFGVYTNVEDVDKSFCARRFKSTKSNTFFKCNPTVTPTPILKSNLRYLGADSTLYPTVYELKSNVGWGKLVELCSLTTNQGNKLDQYMDLDRWTWMLAFNQVFVNLDSYLGVFAQNYYLFKDNGGRYNPIFWDLNMSFGGFPFVGSSNSSLGTLSIQNQKQLPLTIHQTDAYWPVINAIHAHPRWKKMYEAHVRTIVKEVLETGWYETMANQMRATIQTAAEQDTNKFFSTEQYQNSLDQDISGGNYMIPGIRNLMTGRMNYLNGLPAISGTPPQFSNVQATWNSNSMEAQVTASVSGSEDTAVYLNWRPWFNHSFRKLKMYDDGLHGDGAAGDQVFGASFNHDSAGAQLFLYAESSSQAAFFPARAEFEYLRLSSLTSLESLESRSVQAWPNPGNGLLKIAPRQPNQSWTIWNAQGQQLGEEKASDSGELDLRHLPKGMYQLRAGSLSFRYLKNGQ
jgi:hypothetical protein